MAEKLARFQEEKRRATGSMWHEHPINHLKEEKGCGPVVGAFGKENAPENCSTPSIDERAHQLLSCSTDSRFHGTQWL